MVRVRLSGIQDAEGRRLAGVLYAGWNPVRIRVGEALGGFGVAVHADPFSRVLGIGERSPFLPSTHADRRLVGVNPGPHTLLLWEGRSLPAYGEWVPAEEPGRTRVCVVRFEVGHGKVTTLTVTGFPDHATPRSFMETLSCLL